MQVYTVTELAEYVRSTLERDPQLRDVCVSCEISSLLTSAAGHAYFNMRDAGATVRGVLFSGNLGAEHLENGAQVNAHGRMSFYTVRGDAQLIVDAIVPAGLGAPAAEYERLRAKLERDGLFADRFGLGLQFGFLAIQRFLQLMDFAQLPICAVGLLFKP